MRYPASWHGEMWREGAPCGNGLIGALVYGGIYKENILINHAYLWRCGHNEPLPDVSDKLPVIRKLLDENNPFDADPIFSDTLRERGYSPENSYPLPLCDILINTPPKETFSHYRREIDMEKAEVNVFWREGGVNFSRSAFVSRINNLIFTHYTCDKTGALDTSVTVCTHDTETLGSVVIKSPENKADNNYIYYAAYNDSVYHGGDYGAVCRIVTDGETVTDNNYIKISSASDILIITKVFTGSDRNSEFNAARDELSRGYDYDKELAEHIKLHKAYYSGVNFEISDTHTSNEELLLEAFEDECPNELIEKLYAYGRYLFVCSTSDKDTLPCHLTGLWNGSYNCFWAIYMYNINFEMIYWQAASGNLLSFLRLALDYTESFTDDFRENAKKLYGCRGIYINSVNTPESGISKCGASHILNWTGGAAWISQHFWDYYRYTEDMDFLCNHALPFMYEAALFYEDFAVMGDDGYYLLYPSTSPENCAQNVAAMSQNGRQPQISVNAAMETALLKELLTNLIAGCKITGMYPEKSEKWQDMLTHITPYRINTDGAVKEWIHDFYGENYNHRHQSHLYPVFPGCEITDRDDIYPAFVTAEDLRLKFGLKDQSSWSMVFMSNTASRMQRAELSLKAIDTLGRTCLMNNFFTVHNDWRRMGPVACDDFRVAPFQIDGNIGIPAAVNEMLLQSQDDNIFLLPALPKKWMSGKIEGLAARGNIICDIYWDNKKAGALLTSRNGVKIKEVRLGSGYTFEDGSSTAVVTLDSPLRLEFFAV
jgi:alpha-L-fucosidase 2